MAMVRDMLSMPERSEALAPPSLSGAVQPTKFHMLRRRQLMDLARAYKVKVPDGATKEQLVRYMTQAEENGVFRSKPKSQYHLMHAELDHDLYGQAETAPQQEAIRANLVVLEAEEFPKPDYEPAYPSDGRSIAELRERAEELGINSMAKNGGQLRRLIALAEKAHNVPAEPEGAEEAAD